MQVSKTDLLTTIEDKYKWDVLAGGLYLLEINKHSMVLSDKGVIEIRIIIEIDKSNNKLSLRTDTMRNYFLFGGFATFFLIVLGLPGHMKLNLVETSTVIGLIFLSLFIVLYVNRYTTIQKVIKVLYENRLIKE